MRVLVTGAGGMLGSDVAARLAASHDVTGVTRRDFDILDELAIRDFVGRMKPEWVVHCAAYANVDGCEKEPEKAFAVNADGARNLAKACWGVGARLLYVSTDYVFDGKKREPYLESDAPAPLNVYGRSKLKGEQEVVKMLPDALVVRTAWLFGENGPSFVKAILAQVGVRDELSVVDDQVGTPTYTKDLADAMARLIYAGASGVVNVTNEGQCSWFDYAKKILELRGANVRVTPITTEQLGRPAPRPAYSVLSKERYHALTGHRLRPWDEALADYMSCI